MIGVDVTSCPFCTSEHIQGFSFDEYFCEYCLSWFTEEDFVEDIDETVWGRYVPDRQRARA